MIPKSAFYPKADPLLEKLAKEEDLQLLGVVSLNDFERTGEKEGKGDSSKATFEGSSSWADHIKQEESYKKWILAGYHGSMAYLRNHADLKFHPERILPECQSVLLFSLNYYQKTKSTDISQGRIARYAWGRDYHKELGKRLRRITLRLKEHFPGEDFRNFTDSGPLHERYFAKKAGLGYTGKHTLLISSAFGSWIVLGHILSTKIFARTSAPPKVHGACPSSCFRCGDVCPTGALKNPYELDASKCISYLTIEHKGSIPEELRNKMGSWIFGCDLCQEACPLNVRAIETEVSGFIKPIAGSSRDLKEILSIASDEEFLKQFAGSPLMRPGRQLMQRNALVAASNSGDGSLLPLVKILVESKDELLAEHARWSMDKLLKR